MFQVKLKSFKSLQVSAMLSCLLLLLFSPVTFAETEQRCNVYVKSSLQQNKENVAKGCGFSGGRWNNNAAGQKNWCLGVGEHILSSETAERRSLLASCKNSNVKKGKPRVEAKDECQLSSLKQVKSSNPKTLYNCFQGRKNTAQGSKAGYHYRSYLQAFGKENYLLSFIIKANKVLLKTYRIGNSGAHCTANTDGCLNPPPNEESCTFSLNSKFGDMLVQKNCDIPGRDRYSSSYMEVRLTLHGSLWKPVEASSV